MALFDPWYFQRECLSQLLSVGRDTRAMCLAFCVGSGKSQLAVAISGLWLHQKRFRKVLVLTPRTAISEQFEALSEMETVGLGPGVPVFQVGSGPGLVRYMQGSQFGIAVATYDLLRNRSSDLRTILEADPDLARDTLLVPDEGHRLFSLEDEDLADDTRDWQASSVAVEALFQLGVSYLRLTGTPFRADGRPVHRSGELVLEYSLTRAMLEGFAPAQLLSDVLLVEGEGSSDGTEIATPVNVQAAIRSVHAKWLELARPFAVTRVKARDQAWNREANGELLRVFRDHRDRGALISAIDDDEGFLEALKRERARPPASELVPMFAALHKFTEGTDSPSRAVGFMIGVPTSQVAEQQFIGRLMRSKCSDRDHRSEPIFPGYPMDVWGDTSMVFYVVAGVRNLSDQHARKLLRNVAFIEGYQEIGVLRELLDGFRPTPKQTERLAKYLDPKVYADVLLLREAALREWNARRHPFDLQPLSASNEKKLIQAWAEWSGVPFPKTDKVFNFNLTRAVLGSRKNVQRAVRGRLQSMGPSVDLVDGLLEAFECVRDEFVADTKIAPTKSAFRLMAQHIAFHGNRVRLVLTKVSELGQMSEQDVLASVADFRTTHGKFPQLVDLDAEGRSFTAFDRVLQRGLGDRAPIEGGLGEFLVRYHGHPSWTCLAREILNLWETERSDTAPLMAALTKNFDAWLQHRFGGLPEVFYFREAFIAMKAYKGHALLDQLSIVEAARLGRTRKAKATLVEAFEAGGRQGLIAKMDEPNRQADEVVT